MALRLTARYRILTDDFALMDRASDRLMDALLEAEDVIAPDVAVSMTEPSLEVWLELPTDNAVAALVRGAQVLAAAFTKADLATVGFSVAPALLGPSAELHAEAALA